MKTREVKIGFLVKTFPKISETFILREIIALERQGVDLQIFSLRQPEEDKTHAVTSQVKAKVAYVPSSFLKNPLRMAAAHLGMLLTRPWRYLRALRFVLERQESQESGAYKDFVQAVCLAWFMKRSGTRHLHVHFINKPAGVAELAHRLLDLPYSVTAHAKDIYLSPAAVLARKMHHAKFVVTCNEYNRQFLQGVSTNGTPIVRIYHGLDAEHYAADRHGAPVQEAPMILSVGRLREKKGFLCLLNACRLLKIGGHRFRCVIVGYGPMQEAIERLVSEYGLDQDVTLTGMLTLDEVRELYRQATLFVLPCRITDNGDRDGIPNVLVEAMAMELPVISTNVSGIPELVEHMQNGVLVRPEDPPVLAAAITRLLHQPKLREKLGRAGREKVRRQFSAVHNAAHLKALFLDRV